MRGLFLFKNLKGKGVNEMNDEKTVVYQGVTMHPCWPKKIQQAQEKTHSMIKDKLHERIPYGKEDFDWGDDIQPCHDCGEGMFIMNEAERQTDTESHFDKIVISWFKIECGVFQIMAFYTPEANIVGLEICGFPPIKDEYAANYIYLFNWINQIQMKNWWILCPASNRVLLRGGFVISDGKLDKYQFSKLIKNSIENLKLFYPLVTDQESIGKSVTDSILRFSKDNIIDTDRFHNN